MNITVISGSPRRESVTHRVALYLQKELQIKTTHNIDLLDVRDYELPFVQGIFVLEERTPPQFRALRQQMMSSDAFIFVSPEYNGGFSPALKNLVDHFAKDAFIHKAIGLVTASNGALGGIRAAMQMQQLVTGILGILSPAMLIVPAMEKKFDAAGTLLESGFQTAIDNFTREYLWLAQTLIARA